MLAVAAATALSCTAHSRGTRIGDSVILPRSVHCSLEIIQHDEPVLGTHDVIGKVEVWGVGDDRETLEDQLQLRACELGADAVIGLELRNTEDGATWVGQAVVWTSHAEYDQPAPPRPPPDPVATEPVNAEVAPVSSIEEEVASPPPPEAEAEPQSKRKRKGKRKRKKRRRHR